MARLNNAMHDLLRYNAALLPKLRGTFNRSCSKATTFDSGYIVPIMIDTILPGDEVDISIDSLVRMTTPIHPTMDTAYIDFMAFYAPTRTLWENGKAFYGENLDAEYNALNEYKKPTFTYSAIGADGSFSGDTPWFPGSLIDYLEYPRVLNESLDVDLLPCRFYQKVYNEWFRASEIQASVPMNFGDFLTEQEKSTVFTLRKANKLIDYFTSALPQPQGGDSVFLPLSGSAPVVTSMEKRNMTGMPGVSYSLNAPFGTSISQSQYFDLGATVYSNEPCNVIIDGMSSTPRQPNSAEGAYSVVPNNLYADMSGVTATTVNALRTAITIQQALEIDSAGGTRYSSLIRSHYGVIAPDDVLQRTQLLGTARQVVGMRTVAQTSSTVQGVSELGSLGAFSATRVSDEKLVSKSFVEHGYLMICCVVRPLHTYSQGYPSWARKLSRFDEYYPVFNNLGNQPIYTYELYADGTSEDDVFGWKQAYEDLRIKNNAVTGLMRPDVDGSLATWNYADDYINAPVLSTDFIEEDENLIGRTLAVRNEPQFIGDFYFKFIHTRPMGTTSRPGLKRF